MSESELQHNDFELSNSIDSELSDSVAAKQLIADTNSSSSLSSLSDSAANSDRAVFIAEAAHLASLPLTARWLRVLRNIIVVSGPILLMNALLVVNYGMEVAYLGHIEDPESTALSAATLSLSFISIVSLAGIYLGTSGVWTLVSQAHGRGDVEGKGTVIQTAFAVTTVAWMALSVLLFFGADVLALNPHLSPKVKPMVATFLRVSIPGQLFEAFFKILEAALLCQQKILPCILFHAAGIAVGFVSNYLLIFTFGLGFIGAPISLVLVRFTRFILAVLTLVFWKKLRDNMWTPWTRKAVQWPVLKKFLIVSGPAALGTTLEILGFEITSFLVVSFGNVATAAHGIVFQVMTFFFFLMNACGQAICVTVGNFLGAGELDTALLFMRVGVSWGLLVTLIDCIFMGAGSGLLPRIFSFEADVVAATASALFPFGTVLHIPDATNCLAGWILRATGRTFGVSLSNVVGLFAFSVPIGIALSYYTVLGFRGLWAGLAVGAFITTLMQGFFLWRVNWNDVVKEATQNLDGQEPDAQSGGDAEGSEFTDTDSEMLELKGVEKEAAEREIDQEEAREL